METVDQKPWGVILVGENFLIDFNRPRKILKRNPEKLEKAKKCRSKEIRVGRLRATMTIIQWLYEPGKNRIK